MWMLSPPSGALQHTKKLFLSERAGRAQAAEFLRKNAANALSIANLLAGLSSILCSLNGQSHYACLLILIGFLLDLADGAVARQLKACSDLGAKLDDFADFTTFGLASALLLQAHGLLDGLLAILYVLAVFTRLCFFHSGVPFMYRGLPCPYGAAVLATTYLLTRGNLLVMCLIALVMILFMVDQGFYPHDQVLESQAWKKAVYAGGVVMLLFSASPLSPLYYLTWSVSYIFFPSLLWSCKV
ncbi:transmembrane protein 269 isoform X2 [Hemicordylus capensis]|nr:transmembrane protein 269 isoform X2 [Hemicordylus capensis]